MYICNLCQEDSPRYGSFYGECSVDCEGSAEDVDNVRCSSCGEAADYCEYCEYDSYCSDHQQVKEGEIVTDLFSTDLNWVTRK